MHVREWLQKTIFKSLSPTVLTWAFRVLLVLTAVDVLMPDVLPLVDEIGLGWLTYEVWRERQRRVNGPRDVDGEEVQ